MSRRFLMTALVSFLAGALWACESDSGKSTKVVDEGEGCTADEQCVVMDGALDRGCFVISGQSVCKNVCIHDGSQKTFCHLFAGTAQDGLSKESAVETCAADDNGRKYMTDIKREKCENGCDEATGLCTKDDPAKECSKQCNAPGGDPQVCVTISGVEGCKHVCYGNAEGKNKPVCYENGSLPPDSRPQYSVITTCARDDNGTLYATERHATECTEGCDQKTGECGHGEDPFDWECRKDEDCVIIDGMYDMGCFLINVESKCMPKCVSKTEGVSAPMCYALGGFAPTPGDRQSAVETCAKDDNGRIYMVDIKFDKCGAKGCDEATGKCITEEPVPECSIPCNAPGGDPQVCVTISGVDECKPWCYGNAEGESDPVCYENGSLPPESRPQYSVVTTCVKDDNGTLYASKRQSKECEYGCNHGTGKCFDAPVEPCRKDCMLDGGDPQVCVRIGGVESCKTACFGTLAGKNDPVCYRNGSIGPGAPEYSIVDTCAYDDIGTLYSERAERDMCYERCDMSTGECEPAMPN